MAARTDGTGAGAGAGGSSARAAGALPTTVSAALAAIARHLPYRPLRMSLPPYVKPTRPSLRTLRKRARPGAGVDEASWIGVPRASPASRFRIAIGGVRFWDYGGKQHHPVFYAAGGDHASYGYPGATKIKGIGCTEASIISDVHNGNGPKLVPFENAYYTDWGKTKSAVEHEVHVVNLDERAPPFARSTATSCSP